MMHCFTYMRCVLMYLDSMRLPSLCAMNVVGLTKLVVSQEVLKGCAVHQNWQ
jgi:hypothetical protein